MRLCYVLLSATWGMHQYTADLANRQYAAGAEVHVVTTSCAPRDRYAPGVRLHTPIGTCGSGLSPDAMQPGTLSRVARTISAVHADIVHVTGPHLWNPLLLGGLRRGGARTVHTLHDLHPHARVRYGRLLHLWNRWVERVADHLLVHGERYRQELVGHGVDPLRVTCTLLTHLFLGWAEEQAHVRRPPHLAYEPWALFAGRLQPYKGLDVLVEAARRSDPRCVQIVIAGPPPNRGKGRTGDGDLCRLIGGAMPPNVEVRERLIRDEEATDLFRRCGVVVLPYIEASQSALVAAAYAFHKPVIVTRVGALPEYVVGGQTGWVIPPGDPDALAEVLHSALADPAELARMGEAGRNWYAVQRQAEGLALDDMYRSVA